MQTTSTTVPSFSPMRKPRGHKWPHLTVANCARLVVYEGGQWAIETRFLGFLWWTHLITVHSRETGYAVLDVVASAQ